MTVSVCNDLYSDVQWCVAWEARLVMPGRGMVAPFRPTRQRGGGGILSASVTPSLPGSQLFSEKFLLWSDPPQLRTASLPPPRHPEQLPASSPQYPRPAKRLPRPPHHAYPAPVMPPSSPPPPHFALSGRGGAPLQALPYRLPLSREIGIETGPKVSATPYSPSPSTPSCPPTGSTTTVPRRACQRSR